MRPPFSENQSGKSTRRELNQFSKYSSRVPEVQKKAPRKSVLGGALLGFVAISVIYSLLLLGVTRVLRDAGVIEQQRAVESYLLEIQLVHAVSPTVRA